MTDLLTREEHLANLDERRPDIKRGAAWLDKTVPGWLSRIKLEYLNMRDIHDCVAGQVFASNPARIPGYDYVTNEYFSDIDEVSRHGFNVYDHECDSDFLDRAYDDLQELWTAEIEQRRVA